MCLAFLWGPRGGAASPSVEVTSESELSEESSSPEGDSLLAGFDRNQLNQPNPELWRARGIVKASGLVSLTNCESCQPGMRWVWGAPGLWSTVWNRDEGGDIEKNKSSTFVFSFPSPGFPLCEASWWDGSSDPSEDPPSSSLAETVESSENLRAPGASGAWDKIKQQQRFTWGLTDCRAHFHMTSHSEPRARLGRCFLLGREQAYPWKCLITGERTSQDPPSLQLLPNTGGS